MRDPTGEINKSKEKLIFESRIDLYDGPNKLGGCCSMSGRPISRSANQPLGRVSKGHFSWRNGSKYPERRSDAGKQQKSEQANFLKRDRFVASPT